MQHQSVGPAFIGSVTVDPERIAPNGEFVIECPRNSRFLTAGVVDGEVRVWVLAPALAEVERRCLWVVPGSQGLSNEVLHAIYIGTVIVPTPTGPEGKDEVALQDWHVFHDMPGATVERSLPVAAVYTLQ